MSKPNKLQYNGDSKILKYLSTCVNWFLDNHSVDKLDDVTITDLDDGQVLKYDSQIGKFVNADESGGGGSGTNVVANPTGTPIDTLTTIGIDGTRTTYYTENSQICSVNGNYVTSNLDTQLVNGDYKIHITDGAYEFDNNFTYSGSTVILELSANGETYIIEITSTTVGMTYGSGAWRDIYCDIYTEESGQVIYDLETSADNITYDNTNSNLTADNVQDAIDELESTKANTVDLGPASAKNFTTSVTQGSNDLVTSGAVYNEFANLPKPEIFKGTLGVNGTITMLPTASSDNEGWEYKVITAGTYAGQDAKYGDTFISDGTQWVYIPSGDETDTDTWRGINVNGSQLLGNGISSGNVNFKGGTNAQVSGSGNDVTVDVDTTFTDASSRVNIASGDSIKTILGKIKKWFSDLKTVAFSGSYSDLSGKPTKLSDFTNDVVNNATLNIKKNGTSQGTFTANASSDVNIDISVPTKTSDLTNDSGYISDIPFTVVDGKLCLVYKG